MGYNRQEIEDSLSQVRYDDVFATYLLLGRKSTDVSYSTFHYYYCFITCYGPTTTSNNHNIFKTRQKHLHLFIDFEHVFIEFFVYFVLMEWNKSTDFEHSIRSKPGG